MIKPVNLSGFNIQIGMDIIVHLAFFLQCFQKAKIPRNIYMTVLFLCFCILCQLFNQKQTMSPCSMCYIRVTDYSQGESPALSSCLSWVHKFKNTGLSRRNSSCQIKADPFRNNFVRSTTQCVSCDAADLASIKDGCLPS